MTASCLPHADRRSSPQIGLARGARWSVLSIDPPNLSGPFFNLVLREHVLTGWVSPLSPLAVAVGLWAFRVLARPMPATATGSMGDH